MTCYTSNMKFVVALATWSWANFYDLLLHTKLFESRKANSWTYLTPQAKAISYLCGSCEVCPLHSTKATQNKARSVLLYLIKKTGKTKEEKGRSTLSGYCPEYFILLPVLFFFPLVFKLWFKILNLLKCLSKPPRHSSVFLPMFVNYE